MEILGNFKYTASQGNKFKIKLDYRDGKFKDGGFTQPYSGWILNNPNFSDDEISNIYVAINNYTFQNGVWCPNYYLKIEGQKANTITNSASITNTDYALDTDFCSIKKIKDCGNNYIAGYPLIIDGVKLNTTNTLRVKKPFIVEENSKGKLTISGHGSDSSFNKFVFREDTINAMVFRGLIYYREEGSSKPTCLNCPNYSGANYALILNFIEYKPTSIIKNILWRDPFKK